MQRRLDIAQPLLFVGIIVTPRRQRSLNLIGLVASLAYGGQFIAQSRRRIVRSDHPIAGKASLARFHQDFETRQNEKVAAVTLPTTIGLALGIETHSTEITGPARDLGKLPQTPRQRFHELAVRIPPDQVGDADTRHLQFLPAIGPITAYGMILPTQPLHGDSPFHGHFQAHNAPGRQRHTFPTAEPLIQVLQHTAFGGGETG